MGSEKGAGTAKAPKQLTAGMVAKLDRDQLDDAYTGGRISAEVYQGACKRLEQWGGGAPVNEVTVKGSTTVEESTVPLDRADPLGDGGDEPEAGATHVLEPGELEAAAVPEELAGKLFAQVMFPLGELNPQEYQPRRIDATLSPRQAAVLKRVANGLRGQPYEVDEATGKVIADGRLVDSGVRVFYWWLNQIEGQLIAADNADAASDSGVAEGP